MQKIEAIIRPFKLEQVNEVLSAKGIEGATVSEVRVHSWHKANGDVYRGPSYLEAFAPMIKLELVLADEQASETITAILDAAKTGRFGDGKIFVSPIIDAIRIRSGEHGLNAV